MITIEHRYAYRLMWSAPSQNMFTFPTPDTVAVILKRGNIVSIIVPYSEGYDCEGGLHTRDMTEQKFLEEYQWSAHS